VLWSLFLLAALALVIDVSITSQLTLAGRLRDRTLVRYLAEAGFKRAVVELRADETVEYDALNELWSRNEDAFKGIPLIDGASVNVEYVVEQEEADEEDVFYGLIDEDRKININTASVIVLQRIFEWVGETTAQEATDIADSIVDWRDVDDEPLTNGAEETYYQGLDPAYDCKNASFDILEELFLVKGMTKDVFDKVQDHLTIYGTGKVNINTASPVVLQSLGMDEGLVQKIMDFRKGSDEIEASEDDNILMNVETLIVDLSAGAGLFPDEVDALTVIVETGVLKVRSDYFRGHSTAQLSDGGVAAAIDFVVSRNEVVRYWRE